MYCDLHTHSNVSDGTFTPSQLVELAKQTNRVIALTDHNTVAGLPEFMSLAQTIGVTAVGGVELSTEYEGKELHLLGLFVSQPYYDTIENWTQDFRMRKQISNRQTIERLRKGGYVMDYDDIIQRNGLYINRAHIADALCRGGYVASIKEAFDTLLGEEHGYYIPPVRPSFFDALDFLRQVKTIPVLAHPLKDMEDKPLCRLLEKAVPKGLVGMEIYHSSYTEAQSKTAAEIAKTYALLPSGGSDFHGNRKANIPFGYPEIPRQIYDDLLQYKISVF